MNDVKMCITRRSLVVVVVFAVCNLSAAVFAEHGDELAEEVKIRRTEYGVPHIEAPTLEAVAFGFAYCQAEDHLLNIMHSVLRARGELAVTFGGEDNVRSDLWVRQFRVHERAVSTFHRLDPDFRSMLSGFAEGLNYYVRQHRDELPEWIPTVTPHDVAAHGLTGVARFAFNRGRIIDVFLQRERAVTRSGLPMLDETETGSNMIALAPSRTTSGHAMLLGNPHQPWSQVATYYEAHLKVPGQLDFYGSTFVGRPVLTTGFNRNLGWSHTVNYPDLEEIYALDVDPDHPHHYLFDGGSVPLEKSEVTVQMKSRHSIQPRQATFWYSPLGPVIHRTPEKIYVLRSAAYDEFRFYQQWLRLAQANNLSEFQEALRIAAIPMFNICYADREGNIFFVWNGTVPEFPHDSHTSEAVVASTSDDVWTAFHDVSELPQLLNPTGGYVQNCNSPPFFTNLHEPLDPGNFPGYFPRNYLGLRTQHCLSLVHNERKFSLEDLVAAKFSPRMLLAERLKDDLIETINAQQPSGEVAAAVKLLSDWDNTATADSRGSVLFATWWKNYSPDGRFQGFAEPWNANEPVSSPKGIASPTLAMNALVKAIAEVEERYGRWDIAWGDVHRLRQGDVDLPVSGGSGFLGCFRVLGFRNDPDGKRVVNGGDSWVFVVEFGEEPRAYTVVGYSQSEVPGSPHFNDQAKLYAAGEMKPAAFTNQQIEDALIQAYTPAEGATP